MLIITDSIVYLRITFALQLMIKTLRLCGKKGTQILEIREIKRNLCMALYKIGLR